MIAWLVIYVLCVYLLDKNYQLLRDTCNADKKSYSLSRVQLAWWMGLVLCAFVAVVFNRNNPHLTIPTFYYGILVVLGISSGTTAAASLIDSSDQSNSLITRHQDEEGVNLFLDILSDKNGVSVNRLQTVLFNIIFGFWFFISVWKNLDCYNTIFDDPKHLIHYYPCKDYIDIIIKSLDKIIPDINERALILLGLSSGTYAALKTTENKAENPVG